MNVLPTNADERKNIPIVSGAIDYFSAALAYVAQISKAGNDQHNPGQPLHWSRGKSTDHADCIGRHLVERGTFDVDGMRHSGKLAWRALALLQEELEAAGAPPSRGSKFPEGTVLGYDASKSSEKTMVKILEETSGTKKGRSSENFREQDFVIVEKGTKTLWPF